ncbi:MAG: type II secretion system protein [Chloroflexi bacterium]|nr:type II secretion system protein [Chloroflexota bacterium]
MKHLLKSLKGQRGFTLIELVAVMAIMAVLVAVVAPSVTGTRNASIDAQTMQDATQVRSAATNFFKAQNEAEVRTPHSTKVGAIGVTTLPTDKTTGQQVISTRWPEQFITTSNSFESVYETELEALQSPAKVVSVTLLGKDNSGAITGATLLGDYTAIDLDRLVYDLNLLAKLPAGSNTKSTAVGNLQVSNFLWLFEKTDSAADSTDDSREVAVFKLVKVVENEGASTVNLTYERIF